MMELVWYTPKESCKVSLMTVNFLNPKSDQHLISPYSNTTELFIKIVGIKEMITNLRSFGCK